MFSISFPKESVNGDTVTFSPSNSTSISITSANAIDNVIAPIAIIAIKAIRTAINFLFSIKTPPLN